MNTIPSKQTYIYGLVDPRNDLIRYIGKSNNPRVRYRKHVTEIKDTHKGRWIQQLRREGLLPYLIILDEVPIDDWMRYEIDWIACFREQLTNTADGGVGVSAITPETREKMSRAKRGKTPPNKGKKTSEEARQKQSIAAKLRVERMTPEERADFESRLKSTKGVSISGWHHTEESRAKISKRHNRLKPKAKFNREQILEIRKLLAEGNLLQKEIAAMFNVSVAIISNIKTGYTYADWK